MKTASLVLFASSLVMGLSCKSRSYLGQSTVKQAEGDLSCSSGALERFGLSPLSILPKTKDISWLPVQREFSLYPPNSNNALRIDVCFDPINPAATTLKRVVWRYMQGSPKNFYPNSQTSVKGLEGALFGDYSGFEIQMVDEQGKGIFVKGAKASSTSFVAVGNTLLSGEQPVFPDGDLFVGSLLNNFDPFISGVCKPEQQYSTTEISMGSAKVFFELCKYQDIGETVGYEIKKVRVIDSNESLAEKDRKEFAVEGPGLVPPVFEYSFNHHNGCDSFALRLPHASYAATSPSGAGCGRIVPDAPERDFDNDNVALKYRIKYGTSDWQPVQNGKNCMNYLDNRCK